MGKCFSDAVELALKYIYYDLRAGKGAEGFALLEKASSEGDGDATCLLARCYCGSQYVWRGHDFPEDDNKAIGLMHRSVEQGSALGVLVALRSGELTPSLEKKMPFTTLKEAFNEVLKKAEEGEAFCQYVVGNVYFWWDFLRIENKGKSSFSSDNEYKAYLRENVAKCEDWLLKAYDGGMYIAANNLNKYYTKGDSDIIAPRPELARDIYKTGAERGNPLLQWIYGDQLAEQGRNAEAVEWFRRAAEGGQMDCWYVLGRAYEKGEGVDKDLQFAAKCYEKGLEQKTNSTKRIACCNMLGALYYEGGGVPQDYAKAFQLLNEASENGSTWGWGACYLGKMYFRGQGTPCNYIKAREYLEKVDWTNREVFYMLGVIYGRGLGVTPDIPKAVAYLQKAGSWVEAKTELLNYKKNLFGKWVRR